MRAGARAERAALARGVGRQPPRRSPGSSTCPAGRRSWRGRCWRTGKPTVLVLIHGSPLTIPELAQNVPAILDGFYLGEETGTAVAEVLFGDVSPAGRLPVSVPRSVGDHAGLLQLQAVGAPALPVRGAGPALAVRVRPVVHDVQVRQADGRRRRRIAPDGKTTVSVTVTNTGKRASDEVVQLYIHDVVSSVTRPVSELKGFRRIHLKPGRIEAGRLPARLRPSCRSSTRR